MPCSPAAGTAGVRFLPLSHTTTFNRGTSDSSILGSKPLDLSTPYSATRIAGRINEKLIRVVNRAGCRARYVRLEVWGDHINPRECSRTGNHNHADPERACNDL